MPPFDPPLPRFYLHIICLYCVYLLCVYINTHPCIYIFKKIFIFVYLYIIRAATNDYFDNRLVGRLFFLLIGLNTIIQFY